MYKIKMTDGNEVSVKTLGDVLVFLRKHKPATVVVTKNDQPMTVVRNSYNEFGIQQEGNIADLMIAMIDEVDANYVRPNGIVRNPHEMMPNEWKAVNAVGSAAYNVFPCFTTEQRGQRCDYVDYQGRATTGHVEYLMMNQMLSRFGYGHNGPGYDRAKNENSRHEVHVAYALASGKHVPSEVIDYYAERQKDVTSVGEWFALLVKYPEYRGKMTPEKLIALASMCRGDKIVLTNENAAFFIRLMAELPDDATWPQIDNFLYSKGVLKLREQPAPEICDLSTANSPLALKLRAALGEHRKQGAIDYANEHHAKYKGSLRELHEGLAAAELLPSAESLWYPNKMADAIEKKEIDMLLTYLDTPADRNHTTKKVVQEVCGLKLGGLKAADRRNAIFLFCGYNSEMRAAYEKKQEELRAAKDLAREVESIKETAGDNKIRFDGEIMTIAEYVDRGIKNGFNTISTTKKGAATKYWLSNLETGYSMTIQKKDGSLDYAKLVHGVTELRQAA